MHNDDAYTTPDADHLAYLRTKQIVDCELCDDEGMRGVLRCDHRDWAAIAKRGSALVRAELDKIRERKGKTA